MRGLVIILISIFFIGCSNTPDNVISEGRMVDLLVDIHKGESYVDINSGTYYNDSLKKLFKQSILAEHGVSQAQFDSSLVWYGKHIDKYVVVYDEVIKKLQDQDKSILAEAKKAGESSPLAAGDSVNLWSKSNQRILAHVFGDSIMSFDFKADVNFKQGDFYTWQYKLLDSDSPVSVFLGVDYQDGTTGYIINKERKSGWNKIKLQTDSTKAIRRIYGVASFYPGKKNIIYVDSIGLIRMRKDNMKYYFFYQQKVLGSKKFNNKAMTPITATESRKN